MEGSLWIEILTMLERCFFNVSLCIKKSSEDFFVTNGIFYLTVKIDFYMQNCASYQLLCALNQWRNKDFWQGGASAALLLFTNQCICCFRATFSQILSSAISQMMIF